MPHDFIHNRIELKDQRRILRRFSTEAEDLLWELLRGKKLMGRKFRRQHSVGFYVLDFYCSAEKLAIELDGAHHFTEEGIKHDEERTQYLHSLNITVLRFENFLVLKEPEHVLQEIRRSFKKKCADDFDV
jgi:very-short-patch-repair endonuclease